MQITYSKTALNLKLKQIYWPRDTTVKTKLYGPQSKLKIDSKVITSDINADI